MQSPWTGRTPSEGEWFGMERRWKGISQSELARRTGIRQNYISRFELGGADLPLELKEKLWEIVNAEPGKGRDLGQMRLFSKGATLTQLAS